MDIMVIGFEHEIFFFLFVKKPNEKMLIFEVFGGNDSTVSVFILSDIFGK